MDSRMINSSRPKAVVLLKDYLLDDMSSCSSNGFKSFPRRQCCTTVRFLVETDRIKNNHCHRTSEEKKKKKKKKKSKSALSALITATVKRLSFTAGSSTPKNALFLPRSLSKKILSKTGFWKRNSINPKEILRLKSFDELLKEDPEPLDRPNNNNNNNSMTNTSKSSTSWSGSDFTHVTTNDVVEDACTNTIVLVSSDSTTTTDDSSTGTKKQWSNEEKEQLSPVSILDCPFDDEDEVSSPFQHRLARMEGTKNKLMKKIQRFESLAQLEPMNLAKRFMPHQDSDNGSSGSPPPFCSPSIDEKFVSNIEAEENEGKQFEQKALEFLHQIKDSLPSYGLKVKADKLLLDFFSEKIVGRNINFGQKWGGYSFYDEMLEEAEDWIKGRKPLEFLEWDVQKNREAYIKDMEKGKKWKKIDQKHLEEVTLELETEIFNALLDELLLLE